MQEDLSSQITSRYNYRQISDLLTYILILVVLQVYRMLKECQLKYILQDIVLDTFKFTTS